MAKTKKVKGGFKYTTKSGRPKGKTFKTRAKARAMKGR